MFTKHAKGRIRGVKLFNENHFINNHGIASLQCGRITANQIESARRVISKSVKKLGSYKIHIRPTTSVSKKPAEVRMGKGKGGIDHYVSRVKAGQVLFTIEGLPSLLAQATLLKASRKLPIKIKIINQLTK